MRWSVKATKRTPSFPNLIERLVQVVACRVNWRLFYETFDSFHKLETFGSSRHKIEASVLAEADAWMSAITESEDGPTTHDNWNLN
jgi:hypothetical protein